MSKYEIEYCPWCGSDVQSTTKQIDHRMFRARECTECETVFRVEVPHKETQIKWTETQ